MMQYVPEEGVYVYFRYDNHQTVMCVMNTNDREMSIEGNRFEERTKKFNKGKDVVSNSDMDIKGKITIGARELKVLELF
jgi:rRNA processing protein Krr1/Pno1